MAVLQFFWESMDMVAVPVPDRTPAGNWKAAVAPVFIDVPPMVKVTVLDKEEGQADPVPLIAVSEHRVKLPVELQVRGAKYWAVSMQQHDAEGAHVVVETVPKPCQSER